MTDRFDLLVIGAGSGGVRAARMSAGMGAKVAIFEDRYLGGTCVNVGCVPKKLYVYGASFAESWKLATDYGWQTQDPEFNWQQLKTNKDREIARLNGVYRRLLETAGVTLISGRAEFTDAHTVVAEGTEYQADNILVATGSWPSHPGFPGHQWVLDSNQFFSLESLPESAVVIGSGYIGLEFAGILNGLGVETHVLVRSDTLLRGFDPDIQQFIHQELVKKGIRFHFGTHIEAVEQHGTGYRCATNQGELHTGLVISAIGRHPNTDGLGLDAAGVKTTPSGGIPVNDHFQSNVPHIMAIGDVIERVQLTPVALAEGMAVAKRLFASGSGTVNYDLIPTAVFTQPNIATVGLTEPEAIKRFGHADVTVFMTDFKPMKLSLGASDERMMMKLIVQRSTDRVLGAHMVGADAGETIQGIAVALNSGATKAQFDATIGIHPTAAEEFVTLREPVR